MGRLPLKPDKSDFNSALKDKYAFVDLEIFERVGDGEYQNLCDYEVSSTQPTIAIQSNKQFLLGFCEFVNRGSAQRYFAECNLADLLELANINNARFTKQMRNGVDDDVFEHIAAIMCAKKIITYSYGKIIRSEEMPNVYSFRRGKYINRKHSSEEIFKKKFFSLESSY